MCVHSISPKGGHAHNFFNYSWLTRDCDLKKEQALKMYLFIHLCMWARLCGRAGRGGLVGVDPLSPPCRAQR